MARRDVILPAIVVLLASGGFLTMRLAAAGWDPLGVAEIGSQFEPGDPQGTEGYDGQFSYFIARDPSPSSVAPKLDVPAYRFQRILYPVLARTLALGIPSVLPWTLIAVNLLAQPLGTAAVSLYLGKRRVSGWYALGYGLWVGLIGPVGLDLNEPLAYGLVAFGWLLLDNERKWLAASCLTLAVFAKETTLPFIGAAIVASALTAEHRDRLLPLGAGVAVFAAWQLWLWSVFGSPGLGSGGEGASAFELFPFMGLFRIGTVSLPALGLYLVIFGPSVVLPTVWAAYASLRAVLQGAHTSSTWAMLANAVMVMTLPFSTFREPLGLVRVVDGLLLSILLFSADRRWMRPLRFALIWIAFLVILQPD